MTRRGILDLTGEQAAWVEDIVGVADDWATVPRGRLLPLILAVSESEDDAERLELAKQYGRLSMAELLDRVALDDEPGKDESASG